MVLRLHGSSSSQCLQSRHSCPLVQNRPAPCHRYITSGRLVLPKSVPCRFSRCAAAAAAGVPPGIISVSLSGLRATAAAIQKCQSSLQQQPVTELQQAEQPVPLQVTRSNFAEVLPVLEQDLQACQFVSFDCEMSGLYMPGQEDFAVDDVDDRYIKTAAAAESFIVTQFGLSLFVWKGPAAGYEVRSFNFHLFPAPTEELDLRFSCQASSLAFLAGQGFDFNKMIYEGIPFLPLSFRDRQVKAAAEAQKAAATPPALDDLDDDERCLVAELDETISTWLQNTPAADTLYIPTPPPQLLKLQRQLLAAGIGSSRWRGSSCNKNKNSSSSSSSSDERLYLVEAADGGTIHVGSTGGSSGGVVLRRASAAQLAASAAMSQQQRQQKATAAAGFSHVLELIRDSKKPVVGHNLRFDLAFALAGFVQSPLPKTWSGFRELVAIWFPGGVYDTKYLARCLTGPADVLGTTCLLPDTSLGGLFKAFNSSCCTRQPIGIVTSSEQPGSDDCTVRSDLANSANLANLSEWLQLRTSGLEEPESWATLPPVQHTLGCEAYAAEAEAAAGIPNAGMAGTQANTTAEVNGPESGPTAAAGAGLAHEAGYDAFMTGVVFVGLLRLFEIEGLCNMSRWARPSAPAHPPSLEAVSALSGRQYHAKSKDIPYAALSGPNVLPQRPEVIYIGFKPGTRPRWQDIQERFFNLGLGRPSVSLVRENNGLFIHVKGAYVIMPTSNEAVRALQAIRQDKSWKVKAMTYADYSCSKTSEQNGRSVTTRRVTPGIPASIANDKAGSATAAVVQEMQDLAQQLQLQASQARQQRHQPHARQPPPMEQGLAGPERINKRTEPKLEADGAGVHTSSCSAHNGHEHPDTHDVKGAESVQTSTVSTFGGQLCNTDESTTAADDKASKLSALAESQQRLKQLQFAPRKTQPGASLQRPTFRPLPSSER